MKTNKTKLYIKNTSFELFSTFEKIKINCSTSDFLNKTHIKSYLMKYSYSYIENNQIAI